MVYRENFFEKVHFEKKVSADDNKSKLVSSGNFLSGKDDR